MGKGTIARSSLSVDSIGQPIDQENYYDVAFTVVLLSRNHDPTRGHRCEVLHRPCPHCPLRMIGLLFDICATSQHSPRATGRPDTAARSANAATAAPCVSATRRNAMLAIGSGHGRKRAQRVTLPFPYVTGTSTC